MALPAWNEPGVKRGTMIRGALWLIQQIGEGGTFTKEDVRDAFQGVAQADRRIRDLRGYGWVIHTSTDDARLASEQQRFVKQGVAVWDPVARRAAETQRAVTSKERQAALERDEFMCTVCGISSAEPYLDDSNQTAALVVVRRVTVMPDGTEITPLVTECKRCRAGRGAVPARTDEILQAAAELDESDRRRLLRWIERGQRKPSPADRVWSAYRRLPEEARSAVRSSLSR
ncbi:hypothetical protein [Streptomyces sp. B5E4]|uniref:hypothetical protein n=1 Tax=Streptomyces sp. B5E4 TaxID=3153568 RepID=UPI00325E2465